MESGGTDSDGDSAYFFRGLTSGTLKRDKPGAFPLKNVLSEAFKEPRLVLIVVEYSCLVDPPHHDVVQGSWYVQSRLAWHGVIILIRHGLSSKMRSRYQRLLCSSAHQEGLPIFYRCSRVHRSPFTFAVIYSTFFLSALTATRRFRRSERTKSEPLFYYFSALCINGPVLQGLNSC